MSPSLVNVYIGNLRQFIANFIKPFTVFTCSQLVCQKGGIVVSGVCRREGLIIILYAHLLMYGMPEGAERWLNYQAITSVMLIYVDLWGDGILRARGSRSHESYFLLINVDALANSQQTMKSALASAFKGDPLIPSLFAPMVLEVVISSCEFNHWSVWLFVDRLLDVSKTGVDHIGVGVAESPRRPERSQASPHEAYSKPLLIYVVDPSQVQVDAQAQALVKLEENPCSGATGGAMDSRALEDQLANCLRNVSSKMFQLPTTTTSLETIGFYVGILVY
ncbi:hypothetical protein BDQ17DRAFT_1333500 [Cyathus striatus]|nr:hypothetical protein BDQ17DRAFT_1333500 [Cyathus striatus]